MPNENSGKDLQIIACLLYLRQVAPSWHNLCHKESSSQGREWRAY